MKAPVRKYKKSERMKEKERLREIIRERERNERMTNKKNKVKPPKNKLMISVDVQNELPVP